MNPGTLHRLSAFTTDPTVVFSTQAKLEPASEGD